MEAKKHYIPMDFLRFFCALYVVFLHLVGSVVLPSNLIYSGEQEAYAGFYPVVGAWVYYGWIGVPIFFTISGFVISISAARCVSAVDFIVDRGLRILPALWICTSISVVALFFMAPDLSVFELFLRFCRSVVLFPAGPYVDGVVWTLVVEVVFYLYCFLLILLFGKEKVAYLAYFLLAGSAVYYGVSWFVVDSPAWFGQLARKAVFEHGSFFAIGMLMARCNRFKDLMRLSPFMLIGMFISYFQIEDSVEYIYDRYGDYGASDSSSIPYMIWFVACLVIPLQVQTANKALHYVARQVGLMTYPLYLVHSLLGRKVYVEFSGGDMAVTMRLIYTIISVVFVAFLVSRYLEPLVKRWVQGMGLVHYLRKL